MHEFSVPKKFQFQRGLKLKRHRYQIVLKKKVDALESFLKSGENLLLLTEAHPIVISWDYWFTVLLVECFYRDYCSQFQKKLIVTHVLQNNLNQVISHKAKNPTKWTRVFHVETTLKRPFPRGFKVEYTWRVCKSFSAEYFGDHTIEEMFNGKYFSK